MLTCVTCKLTLGRQHFSPTFQDHPAPTCRTCGREKREEARRTCACCQIAKPPWEFSNNTPTQLASYCRPCANQKARDYRAKVEAESTHFDCHICKVSKPRSEYRTKRNGHWDYRCKECNAARAAMGVFNDRTKFARARAIAKKRELEWSLSYEEFIDLRSNPCCYCGCALPASSGGLDRLDNHAGYTPDNVVPCCTECNLVRGTLFTCDEMKLIGVIIAQIKASRAAYGEHPVRRGWGRPTKYIRSALQEPHTEPAP